MAERKMTPKQKAFCEYYIETGNGAEAARRAGYKGKNHDNIASENLGKLAIMEYIEVRMKQIESNRIAKIDEVLTFYSSAMRGEIKDQLGLDPSLKDRISAAMALEKRYTYINGEYKLKCEKLQMDKAKLLLEIEKLKGNNKGNDLADSVKKKMNERGNKDE